MKEILSALGLKDDASDADALKAIGKLQKNNTDLVNKVTGLTELVDQLKAARKDALPKHSPAAIAAKRAAGLTLEQAVEVLDRQAEHDATDPHDEPPQKKKAKG